MSVERIYYEQIKSFEETIELIKNQVYYCSDLPTHQIAIKNMKQILEQHDFVFNELYKKTIHSKKKSNYHKDLM